MLVSKAVGYILERSGSYVPVFVMAGLAYLIAFCFVQGLAPRLEPAKV
jgi:ACS family hexuronate transporter-like MFS transporter